MPLKKSAPGSKGFGENIKEMVKSGHPVKQAVAAAYRISGEKRGDAFHIRRADMSDADWHALCTLLEKWIDEEMREPEHREDAIPKSLAGIKQSLDAAAKDKLGSAATRKDESERQKSINRGKLSKKEEAVTEKTPKQRREDTPESIYLEPKTRKYPYKIKRDGKWVADPKLLLAAERRATANKDDALAARAHKMRENIIGKKQDSTGRLDACLMGARRITDALWNSMKGCE